MIILVCTRLGCVQLRGWYSGVVCGSAHDGNATRGDTWLRELGSVVLSTHVNSSDTCVMAVVPSEIIASGELLDGWA